MRRCKWFGHRVRVSLVTETGVVDTNFVMTAFEGEALASGLKAHTVIEACTRCGHVVSERSRPREPRRAEAERVRILEPLEDPARPVSSNLDGVLDGSVASLFLPSTKHASTSRVVEEAADRRGEDTALFESEGFTSWPEDDCDSVKQPVACEWFELDRIEVTTFDSALNAYVDGRQPCSGHLIPTYPSGTYVCSNRDNHWTR